MDKQYHDIKKFVEDMENLEKRALVLVAIKEECRFESIEKVLEYIENELSHIEAMTLSLMDSVKSAISEIALVDMEEVREAMREIQKKIGG